MTGIKYFQKLIFPPLKRVLTLEGKLQMVQVLKKCAKNPIRGYSLMLGGWKDLRKAS